jgi:hypothetical protein
MLCATLPQLMEGKKMDRAIRRIRIIHWIMAVLFPVIGSLIWPANLYSWPTPGINFLVIGILSVLIALSLSKKMWCIPFAILNSLVSLVYLRDIYSLASSGVVSVVRFFIVAWIVLAFIMIQVMTILYTMQIVSFGGAAPNTHKNGTEY